MSVHCLPDWQVYHSSEPLAVPTSQTFQQLQDAQTHIAYEPGTHYQTKFTHLIGWGNDA